MSDTPPASPDRDARVAALEAIVAEMSAGLNSRDLLIEKLRVQIARMKRAGFGASSEKLAQLELALEELEAAEAGVAAAKPETASEDRPAPMRALPEHLPRVRAVIEPAACACPECGGVLRRLGEDVSEQLDVVPVAWRVVAHVRPKYSCRSCERIVQAPVPARAIARGRATFATLAHVVVSKFDHHLPLYRQAEMMAAQGIAIDRATLAGWTGQAAALLDPIVAHIREQGLAATKLHVDDTPVPVLDPGRGRTATGRLWTYVADDRASASSAPPLVWYRFTPDRSGAHPQAELAAFTGHLQADAYAGFDKLYRSGRVTEVACWAHCRRQFVDLHQTKPTALTTDILARIAALYAVEGEVRGRPPDIRRAARQDRTRPLVDALRAALDDAARRLSPRSEAGKAIAYGLKRWTQFTRFLDDGRLEMDNNIAERAARAASPSAARTGYSRDRAWAANAPRRSSLSSRPASSTASSRRPTSPMCSESLSRAGPMSAATNSCRGTGDPSRRNSPKPHNPRSPDHGYDLRRPRIKFGAGSGAAPRWRDCTGERLAASGCA